MLELHPAGRRSNRLVLEGGLAGDVLSAMISIDEAVRGAARVRGRWGVQHFRKGKLIYEGWNHNIVVNLGLDDLLDMTLSGGTPDTTWFIGLKGTGTPVAADTLPSHASWAEITPYAGNRLAWVDGGVTAQSVDNTASPAAFAINATATAFGAFLAGVNTGTAGQLYAASDFASSRAVISGDTLNVTGTFTSADDGV